MIEIIDRYIL